MTGGRGNGAGGGEHVGDGLPRRSAGFEAGSDRPQGRIGYLSLFETQDILVSVGRVETDQLGEFHLGEAGLPANLLEPRAQGFQTTQRGPDFAAHQAVSISG
jgi:hypothetical protein